jgi:hypothetical protein
MKEFKVFKIIWINIKGFKEMMDKYDILKSMNKYGIKEELDRIFTLF